MKQLLIFAVVGLSMLLGGCMSSGVIDMGHDKYTVEYTSLLGPDNAREWAYSKGQDDCKTRGKQLYPLKQMSSAVYGSSTFSLVYQCLDKNDPQLKAFHNQLH